MSPNFVRRSELRGTRTARTAIAVRTAHGAAYGALLVAASVVPRAGAAQNLVARGDSLYRAGRVFSAESLYYAAARYTPRDPDARLALGRYLAARGALKVGSVLMEEARFFGGNATTIARDLAPVYARLGDYRALDALPGTPLGSAERARVQWLRTNTPLVTGSDSVTLPYTPRERGPLGTVTLLVGADSVAAEIDPASQGLTLDRAWMARKGSKVFPAGARDPRAAVGVTSAVRLGGITLTNVSTRYAALGGPGRARVVLDLLGALSPTFDPSARRLTLRRDRHSLSGVRGTRVPTLMTPAGLLVVGRHGAWPLAGERGRALVRGRRISVNARRGEIVVD